MAEKTVEQLVDDLVRFGGVIVPSDDCGEAEVAAAQASGRFAVRDDGMGVVRRPPGFFGRAKE